MIGPFHLHRPSSLEEACTLLTEHGEDIKILAGGSEIILLLKMGLATAKHVVDIKGIGGLDSLVFAPELQGLCVGGLVTHRTLETSDIVREHFPLIVEMERQLANVRVRNVGTLGGNLCFAEPHADPGTLLLAYGARVKARSVRGERTINLAEFFVDYYETVLEHDEIVVEIGIPKLDGEVIGRYLRFCPGERPMVSVAVLIEWGNGECRDVRLAVGCVGPKPFRAVEVEESLKSKSAAEISAEALKAGESVAHFCDPSPDMWGSTEYKRQIVKTLVCRGLQEICSRSSVRE